MSTLQQFEGESLELLILNVKNQWGSAAKIIKAEKIKPAGLKSLVYKERFSILVEISDNPNFSNALVEDRFRAESARLREDTLVRDPAEFAVRLARAYGEVAPSQPQSPSTSLPFPNLKVSSNPSQHLLDDPSDPDKRTLRSNSKGAKKTKTPKEVTTPLWTRLSKKFDGEAEANAPTNDNFELDLTKESKSPKASKNDLAFDFSSELSQAYLGSDASNDELSNEYLVSRSSNSSYDYLEDDLSLELLDDISNNAAAQATPSSYRNSPEKEQIIDL